jgi:predicted MPP superfamily phosphohydrolase
MRKLRQIPRHRELIDRGLYLKGAALGTLGFCTRSAVDVEGLRREWIEIVEIDLQLQNLPSKLEGIRIAHISDLHYSRTVSSEYLRRCVERLNLLDVDIVLLTGD